MVEKDLREHKEDVAAGDVSGHMATSGVAARCDARHSVAHANSSKRPCDIRQGDGWLFDRHAGWKWPVWAAHMEPDNSYSVHRHASGRRSAATTNTVGRGVCVLSAC